MRQSVRRGAVVASFLLAVLAVLGLWLKALPPEMRGRVLPGAALRWMDGASRDAQPGAAPGPGATAPARVGAEPDGAPGAKPDDLAAREEKTARAEPGASGEGRAAGAAPESAVSAGAPAGSPPPPGSAASGDARQASRTEPPVGPAHPVLPSFDIVRVEPSGESVVAGRAAPGATIEMLRGGAPFARTLADPSGLFAFVPPALPSGTSDIALRATSPDGARAQSRENVVVEIGPKRDVPPLVTLMSPDRPTVVLSTPEPPTPARAEATPARPDKPPAAAAPRAPVRIVSVDAEEGGKLYVSGQATPGASVRLYLNDTLIAPGSAGANGQVSFAIGRGVRPGKYKVRLDEVDPVSGDVKTRAEIAFGIPEPVAVASAADAPKGTGGLETRPGGEAVSGPFGAAPPARPAPTAPGEPPGRLAAAPSSGASRVTPEPPGPPAVSPPSNAMAAAPSGSGPVDALFASKAPAPPSGSQASGPAPSSGAPLPGSELFAGSGSPDGPHAAAPSPSRAQEGASPAGRSGSEVRAPDGGLAGLSSSSNPSSSNPSRSSSGTIGEAGGTGFTASNDRAPASRGDQSQVVVPEISTAAVSRGDNLWSISRRIYGRGMRYTMIFGANKEQIRDPDLIYPGQLFVLPPDASAQP